MYKVINYFTDLEDNNHVYNPADPSCNTYPREGLKPTDERIAELSGKDNKQGKPLIEKVEEKTGIENMKVDDLKAYAKENGIKLDGATKKDEILAKIKEAEAAK